MTTLTTAEILAELEAAAKHVETPDDAFTIEELRDATGWGGVQIRNRLKLAKKAGRLAVVKVKRENLMGNMQPVPAYRILPAKKGKKVP